MRPCNSRRRRWFRQSPWPSAWWPPDQLLHDGGAVRHREHGALGPHAHVAAGHRGGHGRVHRLAGPLRPGRPGQVGGAVARAAVAVAAGRRSDVRRGHDAGRAAVPTRTCCAWAGAACARWWCWSSSHLVLHDAQGPVRPVACPGWTRSPSTWAAWLGRPGPGHAAGRLGRLGAARRCYRRGGVVVAGLLAFVFKDARFRANAAADAGRCGAGCCWWWRAGTSAATWATARTRRRWKPSTSPPTPARSSR
jgi:hypothetical protein